MKKLLIIPFIALLFFGCANRLTDFTIISTKNVNLEKKFAKGERVLGEDKTFFLLGIPLGRFPTVKGAIDDAIQRKTGATALADGVVSSGGWTVLFVSQMGYTVEGTVLTQE